MWAVLDCGTTNTKCYLIERSGMLLYESYTHSGCRLNVDDKEKRAYSSLLKDIVVKAIRSSDHEYSELEGVVAFGMVSSDLGLVVVPHLDTPAGISNLADGIFDYTSAALFGEKVKFWIVRGVRNKLKNEREDENVDFCDYMRGEETQVAGIISLYFNGDPMNVIILGTHFKMIHVDGTGRITRSMTTMSGQMYDSIVNGTIVGKSVKLSGQETLVHQRKEILQLSRKMLERYGFNRAAFLPRFMESFTNYNALERLVYLDGVLACDDVHSINDYMNKNELKARKYYIVGPLERGTNLKIVLQDFDPAIEVMLIDGSEKNRDISIAGVKSICRF